MQRVPALEQATRTMFDAMRRGDADAVVGMVADDADVAWIGTDPQEFWQGYDTVASVIRAQLDAVGGLPIEGVHPLAYGSDDIAWVRDQPRLRLPAGGQLAFRITGVARHEAGGWRFVQFHASIGVANQEAFSAELPV